MKNCEKNRKGCTMKNPEDKHKCPLLCSETCNICEIEVNKKRKACSHSYNIACHVNIDNIICEKPCTKVLPCGHKCFNKCFEECSTCKVKVS